MDKLVTITEAEYRELLDAATQLRRLKAAGVDNWEGYGEGDDLDEDD